MFVCAAAAATSKQRILKPSLIWLELSTLLPEGVMSSDSSQQRKVSDSDNDAQQHNT